MRRATAWAGSCAALLLSFGLAGCSSADPAAVAAVGLDSSGYFGVVMMCDQGRTFTYTEVTPIEGDQPTLAWIGRTVEPITFFQIVGDPPDNWKVDVEGGLIDGVEYEFEAAGEDWSVTGPTFSLEDLRTLTANQVIDTDGTVLAEDEFLDEACSR